MCETLMQHLPKNWEMQSEFLPANPTSYIFGKTRYRWQDNIKNDVGENSVAVKTVSKL